MFETIKSIDFILPVICITLLIFLSTRLYSFRNMSNQELMSISFVFVLGKLVYKLDFLLILVYVVISFINANYILPIVVVVISFIFSKLLLTNKKLPPSTSIPKPIMIFNCLLIILAFVVFLVYVIKII